ncbi:aspartyl-phosphate phosphatase Spo0E family protein [Clostridium sp. K25]|uniref:aspartyl-phosphate phosphatase Spo0E family protein n=1 Tax=Clostridium sp. K25 TaxID=1443109 RepID=UPI000908263D|nr:aspartyl-phosphate phosphatase Spo0E family protein [Clostridium sp. K25]
MNELSNSSQEIKVLIEKLRDPLNELVVYSGKDDFDEEIIKLSEVLDKLIAKYMIYTK